MAGLVLVSVGLLGLSLNVAIAGNTPPVSSAWWFHFPLQCDPLLFPVQSPVELATPAEAEGHNLPELTLSQEYTQHVASKAHIINDGYALALRFSNENGSAASTLPGVAGGPLVGEADYRLDHVEWHWGENDTVGGEHVVDAVRSPLEVQFVHFDARAHLGLREALKHANGVVVLAFQFDVSDEPVASYDFLPKYAEALRKAGATAALDRGDLPSVADLMGDSSAVKGDYFYYHGSSTRPPCHNTLTWIVFAKRLRITKAQLSSLRTLEDKRGDSLVHNYREPQPLAGRRPLFRKNYAEYAK